MKIFLCCILLFTISFAHSQDLKNTEWVKIAAEKKDGSKITDKIGRDEFIENFFFKDTSVLISHEHQYLLEEHYHIENGVLTLGNFLKFSIDTVNDILLEITEIPKFPTPDSKLNTYAFIKSRYLFEYLKENNQIQIFGDTLIQCTKKFAPVYSKDDLLELLKGTINSNKDSLFVSGYFIIDSHKKITMISLNPSSTLNERKVKIFNKILEMTGDSWILPETDKPYSFKMNFSFHINKKYFPITSKQKSVWDTYYYSDIQFNPDSSL